MSDSEIFKTALALPKDQRQDYLDEACGDNHELRKEVETLLRASDANDSFLEKPAAGPGFISPTVGWPPISETAGSQIGPYKLLQRIGEGGMGVVYLAEQQEPVRRKVALKIIKPGMDSRQVIARFEAERQALAIMDHQSIARVLDAGTTETARPYFVMELVRGVPITDYCDRNRLTPRERLELFIPVCQAVQHAHQKGIIHRDIKPSNVLVCLYDGQPVPKVIDFGVAKATEQRLTEKTLFTQHGQIVGTLEYMSPEQAEMNQLDVDTRSDIFSLGVLLYELLTGSTPITKEQLREAGFVEMLRLIRESEPEKPSTRLSRPLDTLPSVSAQRSTESRKLGALLRGELDWIVMRALEKDRTRRYATASDFARDIKRYLDDEPVEACPPSTLYRAKKYCRKHKTLIATAALIGVMLSVGVYFYRHQAIRATNAERLAVTEAQRATNSERDAREQLQEAIRQKQRAENAESSAKTERDRAIAAEQVATEQRERAETVTVDALHTLGQSAFHNARAVNASDQPGRRWAALAAIKMANSLQNLTREDLPGPGRGSDGLDGLIDSLAMGAFMTEAERVTGRKPRTDQLRSEAVAALLKPDGRIAIREWRSEGQEKRPVLMQWDGHVNAVSPDAQFLATTSVNVEKRQTGLSVVDLKTGEAVWSPEQQNLGKDFPLIMAVSSGGTSLAWFSITKPGTLKLRDLAKGSEPTTLTVPGPSLLDATRKETDRLPPVGGQPSIDKPIESLDGDLPEPQLTDAEKKLAYQQAMRDAVKQGAEAYQNRKSTNDTSASAAARIASGVLNFMIGGLYFSPDGQWLAGTRSSREAKGEILLWDLNDGSDGAGLVVATVDMRPQLGPTFSADSRLLAWADGDGTVRLWNLTERKLEKQLELPLYLDGVLAFTPDGTQIVTHGHHPDDAKDKPPVRPGYVLVWDIVKDRVVGAFQTSPTFLATAISVAPDGRRVVASQMNGELLVIDLASGNTIRLDHGAMPTFLNWTRDSERVISTGIGAVKVWELSTETSLRAHMLKSRNREQHISRFALSPDMQTIAVETGTNIALYDLNSGEPHANFNSKLRPGLPGSQLIFSPDGKQVVRSGFDGVRIWDVAGDGQPHVVDEKGVFKGSMVTSLGFQNGTPLLAGFDEFRPAVKNALSGKLIWKRDNPQRRAWPRMSRDGSLVAFHSENEPGRSPRIIEVCQLPNGDILHQIPSSRKELNYQTVVDISPDNRWLIEIELAVNLEASWAGNNPLNPAPTVNISGGTNQSWRATVWNVETGEQHCEIGGDVKTESMAFSPNGRYFGVTQRDGVIVLWDLDGRQRLFQWHAWEGTPEVVMTTRELVFTVDSRFLATASETSPVIRLLDLEKLDSELVDLGLAW